MLIEAQSTICKTQNQLKCPTMNKKRRNFLYVHMVKYCILMKKGNYNICVKMDGSGVDDAKWNKPSTKRQIQIQMQLHYNPKNKRNNF